MEQEDIAHAVIVVLTYVDQAPIEDFLVLAEFADEWCDLHELGAGGHGVVLGVHGINQPVSVRSVAIGNLHHAAANAFERFDMLGSFSG